MDVTVAPPAPVVVAAAAPAPVEAPACANCGAPAGDAFCPRCGQEQHDLHRSVRSIVDELLDSLAGWDGKIPATLWLLVRHPGRLTAEFLGGRRARYLRPLRLYLTLSVVYFVGLAIDRRVNARELDLRVREPVAASTDAPTDPAAGARAAAPAGAVERAFEARMRRFAALPKAERDRAFSQAFYGQLSNMVFVLVPAFALLLRLAYRRAPLFYAEHLVHALHLHLCRALQRFDIQHQVVVGATLRTVRPRSCGRCVTAPTPPGSPGGLCRFQPVL
ncbi:DUF3667 domain-containing protein [Roseisolibacter sp. H3M3-2]|uniref:DUF3667 domain-containing protein n=1 Tax=Roseisolibacter sp. H3M3-2 TaxID=3031323 RepID=UPI0023DA5866|nr:DUF3667 domain-containing protein [Roseisolibacter sp. H3M3-2]MDF1504394.1 DUF3667 domain-containing protein [Roseisolibacter sp. H3M3-2]